MLETILQETPSQTAGPYVHIGLIPRQAGFEIFQHEYGNVLVGPETQGERIRIEGRVFDATGHACRDIRQAKPLDAAFQGWGRAGTDFATGLYWFETIKPGAVEGRHTSKMAPHVSFWLVARGINIGLQTRMYFSDEDSANEADPVLNIIEQPHRRQTLVAKREQRHGKTVYVFDIHLQGEHETVFFDV